MRNARATLFYSVVAVFAATSLITLLGVAGVIDIEDEYLDVLFFSLLIELVAAVVGLFKATDWFGGSGVSRGVEAVQGGWWQFARSRRDAPVAFLWVGYSDTEQQLALEGEAYTAAGNRHSSFWSVAASLNAATLDLHYFWTGDHDESGEDFSGVGAVHFTRPAHTELADRGLGWFTAGDIDRLHLTEKVKVEVRRATDEESALMRSDGEVEAKRDAVRDRYAAWASQGPEEARSPLDGDATE